MTIRAAEHFTMTPAREAHLQRILEQLVQRTSAKYRAGQAEHGGDLAEKANLLDEALSEVIDLAIYLLTLREQLASIGAVMTQNTVMATESHVLRQGRAYCPTCKITRTYVKAEDAELWCQCGALCVESVGDD